MHISSVDKIHIDYSYDLFCAICMKNIQTVSEILHYFPLDFRYKRQHIRENSCSAQYENVLGMNIVGVAIEYGNMEILKFVLDKGYDMYTWSIYTSDISILMHMYTPPFLFFRENQRIKMIEPIIRMLSDYGYNWNRKYITKRNVSFLGKTIIAAIVETISWFSFQLFKLLLEVGSDPYHTIQIIYPDSHYHESLDYVIDNLIDNVDTKAQFLDCLGSYRLTTSKLLYMHLFSVLSIIENDENDNQFHDYTLYNYFNKLFMWIYRDRKCIFDDRHQRETFTTLRFRELLQIEYKNNSLCHMDVKAHKHIKYRNTPKNVDDKKMINNKHSKIHHRHKNIIKNIHKARRGKCYSIQQMHRSSKNKY